MSRLFFSLFLLLFGGSSIYWIAMEVIFEPDIQAFDDQVFLQTARAPILMTSHKLQNLPQHQWWEAVEDMKTYFPVHLKMVPLMDLEFDVEDLVQLERETIFVLDHDDGSVAFHKIPNSTFVLTYGPEEPPSGMEALDNKLRLGWVILMATLMIGWVAYLYLRLNRLKTSIDAFRKGRFETRTGLQNQGFVGHLGLTFDQMANRIETMMKEKTQLIAAVSHEMRTPLSRLAFSRHFLTEILGTEQEAKALLLEMDEDLAHLEALVNDLLTYSRLEFQLSKAEFKHVPFEAWCRAMLKRFNPRAKKLQFKTFPELEQVTVTMVPNMLEKAFNNLIDNGLRHSKSQVLLRVEPKDEHILIHVDDDGDGIDPEDWERVFEPFVRLDDARNRDAGGWGLGTALSQEIIRWHGGDLSIENSPEGGARFTVRLKRARG